VRHWLFFQKEIGVFTEENASGNVLDNGIYQALILCIIAFGGATAVKRVILSNVIGKRLVGEWEKVWKHLHVYLLSKAFDLLLLHQSTTVLNSRF
jgi:hypothetical protein